jgi:adenylate cyclase
MPHASIDRGRRVTFSNMSVEAPAVLGGRSTDEPVNFGVWQSIRGISERQVRIVTGLVMFSYLLSHYTNHALGNISFETMQAALQYHLAWWRNPIITFLFYTAAFTHFLLGLWALYQRRHFRYATAEIIQLILGLSIPLLLITHFAGVRLPTTFFDRTPNYGLTLNAYWWVRPHVMWIQFTLILVAWCHACIGLYFWLRMKPFFKWAAPFLLAGAVLLPPLAMLGAYHGARQVAQLIKDPQWRAQYITPMSPPQRKAMDDIIFYFPFGYVALLMLVFAARGARSLNERRGGMITLSYPDRQVRVPKGMSVLEGSLRFNIPHASVCGGRARCSTCRIRVISDRGALPQPSGREAHVLQRVGASADPAIRLACQLRPTSDIAFIPVLPPFIGAEFVRNRGRVNIGKERYVVSMFVDMRGSTALVEERLPFDAIFLVNRFLEAVSKAVVDAGGQPNQFIGDGLLALFGLDADPVTACRQALKAAAMVATNVEHMNYQFGTDLRNPIQFGIGIHGGEVIVGDIGYRERTVFTALGDAVNVAARLQDMTKSLDCKVIVSEEVYRTAGVLSDLLTHTDVAIRGRDQPLAIRTGADPTVLSGLMEPSPAATAMVRHS